MSESVLIGFSGGARSTILAALLAEQGYSLHAVYFDFSDFSHPAWREVHGCRPDSASAELARKQAHSMGLDLEVVSAGGVFEQRVSDPTLQAAVARREEHPGILFHSQVLLPLLYLHAQDKGMPKWASGHRVEQQGLQIFVSPKDHDQAHLVAFARAGVLETGLFPLGAFQDSHLERLGAQLGINSLQFNGLDDLLKHPAARDPLSWREWAKAQLPMEFTQQGWIRHPLASTGIVEHPGIYSHPIGAPVSLHLPSKDSAEQEEKHEIALTEELWAADYEASNQTLWAAELSRFSRKQVALEHLHWRETEVRPEGLKVDVLICNCTGERYFQSARLSFHSLRTGLLEFDTPCPMLFLGTRVLFLQHRRVLGHAQVSSAAPIGEGQVG